MQQTNQHTQIAASDTNKPNTRGSRRGVTEDEWKMAGRKSIAYALLCFILACAVPTTAPQASTYPNANAQRQPANVSPASAARQPTVAIFRFAGPSEKTDTALTSSQVCPRYTGDAKSSAGSAAPDKLTVDPEILDAISNELQKELAKKKMSVMVDPSPDTIPVGSFIVCGSIFNAKKGSPVGRMIGLGLGASRLSAHIDVLSKTERGFTPIDSFDLKLKGRNLSPPGLGSAAFQAVIMERRQKLSALARKLAGRVVKRLDGDLKRPEPTTKAG